MTCSDHGMIHDCWRAARRIGGKWGIESRDRKSTRLNSSHQIISYAVFCLTKEITDSDQHEHARTPGPPATFAPPERRVYQHTALRQLLPTTVSVHPRAATGGADANNYTRD